MQYVSKIIMYLKDQTQNTNTNSSNLTAMLSFGQHNANTVQSSMGQGVTSGGQMTHHGVPSPSSGMINTPGQQPSPASSMSNEDRAYMEKVKQLQDKYLPTLREIAQILGRSEEHTSELQSPLII